MRSLQCGDLWQVVSDISYLVTRIQGGDMKWKPTVIGLALVASACGGSSDGGQTGTSVDAAAPDVTVAPTTTSQATDSPTTVATNTGASTTSTSSSPLASTTTSQPPSTTSATSSATTTTTTSSTTSTTSATTTTTSTTSTTTTTTTTIAPTTTTTTGPTTHFVNTVGTSFSPASITINAGDTVVWTNMSSSLFHTVTSGPRSAPDGLFNSALNPGATFSHTFNSVGTVVYHCIPHGDMDGTVTVTG